MLPLSVYGCFTQERLVRRGDFRGILQHCPQRGRLQDDDQRCWEHISASRQCLTASFNALVPRVQPAAASASKNSKVLTCLFPPAFLSLGASFKKVEVLQPGSLGNSGEKNYIMSFPWWILCVIDHSEEGIANQTGRTLLKTASRRALVMFFYP